MNAVATETLGQMCVKRGIERYVFASSLLAVRRPAAGHARRERADRAARAYATSKRYGEEALLKLADEGLTPGAAAQRHGLRLLAADALRPGRQHVRQGRAADRKLLLHGGGWMWRPLVDVRDVADAMIAAYEAPAEKVRGEIFNVLHSNYQIRELAMIVAGSVQLDRARDRARGGPAPKLTRDYECSNAKLSVTLGFIPRCSVLEAVTDLLDRIGGATPPS